MRLGKKKRGQRLWYVLGLPEPASMRPLAPGLACFATNRITTDGAPVGFMIRLEREPGDHASDSGWQFLAGDEDQAYLDDPENTHVFSLNTIANDDPAVISFLDQPRGTAWVRQGDSFVPESMPWPAGL